MIRTLLASSAALIALSLAAPSAPAQGFAPPDPGAIFGYLDRNRDGRLDADEIDNSRGPFRDRMREMRIDYSRGISRDDFSRVWERIRSGEGERRDEDRRRDDDDGDRRRDEDRRRDDERRSEDGRSDSSRSSSSPSSSSSSRPAPPRPRVTVDLQQTFREGDRDFDGQIGLYEWLQWKGRSQRAEFAVLDANFDGFVTPREIEAASVAAPTPGGPSAPAPGLAANRSATTGTPPAPQTPASAPPAAAPSAPAPLDPAIAAIVIDEANPSVRRYRSSYKLLDRDGNGAISTEEWQRSTNIRGRLTAANVDLTQPMNSDTFVRYMLHLDASANGS
jgi:hypothetical protein